VHVEVVVIESDDVASAVGEEVMKYAITKLVVGASTGGLFKRYLYNDNKFILAFTLTNKDLLSPVVLRSNWILPQIICVIFLLSYFLVCFISLCTDYL